MPRSRVQAGFVIALAAAAVAGGPAPPPVPAAAPAAPVDRRLPPAGRQPVPTGEFGRRSDGGFWRTYDARDGLGADAALCLFQDRTGYLWIGTDTGARRFDGQTFRSFGVAEGLAGARVTAITEDATGHLWFATDGGISRYDGERFTSYSATDPTLTWRHEDALAGDEINVLFTDDRGALWIGTTTGVSRLDDGEFTTLTREYGLADDDVRCILQDREGRFWFGTGDGVSRYDGQLFHTYGEKEHLAGPIHFIHQHADGTLWFGTDTGVTRFDGELFSHFDVGERGALSVGEDLDGTLWFGTGDGVVYRLHEGEWETFTPAEGPAPIVATAVDRRGHRWFGHAGAGVSRFDGQTWTLFPTGSLQPRAGQILEDREGVVWFATSDGIYRYDGQAWTTYAAAEGLTGGPVHALGRSGTGRLLAATDAGLHRLDGQRWLPVPEVEGRVRSILADEGRTWAGGDGLLCLREEGWLCYDDDHPPPGMESGLLTRLTLRGGVRDASGALWWATPEGLLQRVGGRWRLRGRAEGLAWDDVLAVFTGRPGEIWAGTATGLSRLRGTEVTTFTRADGLPHDRILAGAVDADGVLWIGTPAGLSRFDGDRWQTWTAADGLAQNRVIQIAIDAAGQVWCGTERSGVSRFDGRAFQTYLPRDGLAGGSVRAILHEAGVTWLATEGGLTRFAPPQPAVKPVLILDAVLADRRYGASRHLSLPSDLGLIAFQYHAISFKTRPEALLFRYRLRGWRDAWRTTHARTVRFEDVPEGTYHFEVEAIDRDLVASDPATLDLVIHPPRERMQWLAAVAAALLLALIQSLRLHRARRQTRGDAAARLEEVRQQQRQLMPQERCDQPGLEIIGRCLVAPDPAGSAFAYLPRPAGPVITLLDVDARGAEALQWLRVADGIARTALDHDVTLSAAHEEVRRSCTTAIPVAVRSLLVAVEAGGTRISISNDGWPAPLHWRDDRGETAAVDGVEATVHLGRGDRLMICGRGVAEVCNDTGESFAAPLAPALQEGAVRGMDARLLLRHLFAELFQLTPATGQEEDHLILLLARTGDGEMVRKHPA